MKNKQDVEFSVGDEVVFNPYGDKAVNMVVVKVTPHINIWGNGCREVNYHLAKNFGYKTITICTGSSIEESKYYGVEQG